MRDKAEIRMTKPQMNPNTKIGPLPVSHPNPYPRLGFISSFVIRHSSLLLLFALLPSCSKKSPNPNVLARVGNHCITVQDFEREAQWYEKSRRPMPEKEVLLQQMINRELRLQKAKAAGLENDPDVKRRYEAMLAGKVEDLELKPKLEKVEVSSEEIHAEYEKEITRYSRPAKLRLALVFVKANRKATPEQVADAEARITDARKVALALPAGTKGLGAAAADYSDDQASRYRGGDVGWFDEGLTEYRWPTEVVTAGLRLHKNGDISDIIKTTEGFYFVSRTDSRDPVVTPLEQVQASIQRRILGEKRQQAEAAFNKEIGAFAPVETFSKALSKVQYPSKALPKSDEPRPPALQGLTFSSNGQSAAN
jgi:peptidyl-prolyl cis-trans isomerase C